MSALMARIARFDHDLVFFGLGAAVSVDQVKRGDFVFGAPELEAALPPGAVYMGRDCDLPPARYRLQGPNAYSAVWHFVPLPKAMVKDLDKNEVPMDRALYEQLRHLHQVDPSWVSPIALTWAKQFETSFDKELGRVLHYFRDWAEKGTV